MTSFVPIRRFHLCHSAPLFDNNWYGHAWLPVKVPWWFLKTKLSCFWIECPWYAAFRVFANSAHFPDLQSLSGTRFFPSFAVHDRDTRNMRLRPNSLIHHMRVFFSHLDSLSSNFQIHASSLVMPIKRSDQAKLLSQLNYTLNCWNKIILRSDAALISIISSVGLIIWK